MSVAFDIGLYREVMFFARKMAFDPNNMTVPKSFRKANPTVAQVPMMSIVLAVSISLEEKPKKL